MRKTLVTLALAGLAGATFAGSALAEPSADCGGEPVLPPAGTSGKTAVCVTEGPVTGSLSAEGSADGPDGPSGYIVIDGDSTNEGALQGYIGIDSRNEVPYTGECQGDHSDANHDEIDPNRLTECAD